MRASRPKNIDVVEFDNLIEKFKSIPSIGPIKSNDYRMLCSILKPTDWTFLANVPFGSIRHAKVKEIYESSHAGFHPPCIQAYGAETLARK